MLRLIRAAGGLVHQHLEDVLRLRNRADFVVLHLRLPGDERERIREGSDLVDQPKLQRLAAGIDAAAGQLVDRLRTAATYREWSLPREIAGAAFGVPPLGGLRPG